MKTEVQLAVETVQPFLSVLLSASFAQLGCILQDHTKVWRIQNASRLAEKVRLILDRNGVTPEALPTSAIPDVVLGLLDSGSKTSDPLLAEMFANLLVSAVLPETAELTHPSYGHILAQFSSIDAKIVKACLDSYNGPPSHPSEMFPEGFRSSLVGAKEFMDTFGCSRELIDLSIINLQRLGVVEDLGESFRDTTTASFTSFGLAFAKACNPQT